MTKSYIYILKRSFADQLKYYDYFSTLIYLNTGVYQVSHFPYYFVFDLLKFGLIICLCREGLFSLLCETSNDNVFFYFFETFDANKIWMTEQFKIV